MKPILKREFCLGLWSWSTNKLCICVFGQSNTNKQTDREKTLYDRAEEDEKWVKLTNQNL